MSNFERQRYIKKQSIETVVNVNYHSKKKKYRNKNDSTLFIIFICLLW